MNAIIEKTSLQTVVAPQAPNQPSVPSAHAKHPSPARTSVWQAMVMITASTIQVDLAYWDLAPAEFDKLPADVLSLTQDMLEKGTLPGEGEREFFMVTHHDGTHVTMPKYIQYRLTAALTVPGIQRLQDRIERIEMRSPLSDFDVPRGTYVPKPYVHRIEQCLHFHTFGIDTEGRFSQWKVPHNHLMPALRKGDRIIVDRSKTDASKGGLFSVGFLNEAGEERAFTMYARTLPGGGMCLYESAAGRRVRRFGSQHGEMQPMCEWHIATPNVYHSPRRYLTAAQVKAAGYYIVGKVVGHNSGDIPI